MRGDRTDEIESEGVRGIAYDLPPSVHFVATEPRVPRTDTLGERIKLIGYDLARSELVPGTALQIRFYWTADAPIQVGYKVFTHLIGPNDKMYSQMDGVPQGYAYPTTHWQEGEVVLDDYRLELPQDMPIGNYALRVGMYDPVTMVRLPVSSGEPRQPASDYLQIDGLYR